MPYLASFTLQNKYYLLGLNGNPCNEFITCLKNENECMIISNAETFMFWQPFYIYQPTKQTYSQQKWTKHFTVHSSGSTGTITQWNSCPTKITSLPKLKSLSKLHAERPFMKHLEVFVKWKPTQSLFRLKSLSVNTVWLRRRSVDIPAVPEKVNMLYSKEVETTWELKFQNSTKQETFWTAQSSVVV